MYRKLSKLAKVEYYSYNNEVHLLNYAETIVIDPVTNILIMMRYGGYSESVKGMADAIWAGGKIDIDLPLGSISVNCVSKSYMKEIKKDKYYSECLIRRKDDENKVKEADIDNDDTSNYEEVKRSYIYIKNNNKEVLFNEIDKRTSIPMLPEFKDYIINSMIENDLLYELDIYSVHEEFSAYCMKRNDDMMQKIVEEGLRKGKIAIPKATEEHRGLFKEINGVTDYLRNFAAEIAEKIKTSFKPLFDPAIEKYSPVIDEVEEYLYKNYLLKNKKFKLFAAQKAVIESVQRKLQKDKVAWIIGECGTGKSKMGAIANYVYSKEKNLGKTFNGILCPGMIKEKWVREIEETLPNTKAYIIHNIDELENAYKQYKKGKKNIYVIISKETARDGYMKKPAIKWNPIKKCYVCPDCGEKIEMELSDDGVRYTVDADQFIFRTENSKNHKCVNCGSLLWTTINPSDRRRAYNNWVKIADYGFIYRDKADEVITQNPKDEKLIEQVEEIIRYKDIYFSTKCAYRRYGLSTYIKKKMKGFFDCFILDELHLYKGDTGQGNAMAELVKSSRKIIGMTATLINGYSQGIFYLLFRCFPNLMLKDGKQYTNTRDFNREYGVIEETYELKEAKYNVTNRARRTKKKERLLPGVSPIVFTRFLLDNAVFLSLNDMTDEMPEYEEIPILEEMDEEVKKEYNNIEMAFKKILQSEKKIARKLLSTYLDVLSIYPDQPYGHKPIQSPIDKSILLEPKDVGDESIVWPKEQKVLEIVRKKINNGEKVLIYTNWIKTDTQQKLKKLLTNEGFRTEILTTNTVNIEKREKWVENALKKGLDVLITNPALVEMGLDLNDFTTIIFYNVGYNLFNFRQSSRRSWRINQTRPRVEVYIMCYKGTMQNRAIRLMASKLAVATTIEGNISDEGLAAMSDAMDMTTALARELALGIENEVEDVAAIYKKMAILKPKTMQNENQQIEEVINAETEIEEIEARQVSTQIQEQISLLFNSVNEEAAKKKRKKVNENQLSIFDLFKESA